MGDFQFGMLVEQVASTATAAGTTTLTNTSKQIQYFTGTTTQTIKLPATTNMVVGQFFEIFNASTGIITIQYTDASSFTSAPTIPANGWLVVKLVSIGTTNGTWAVEDAVVTGIVAIANGGTGQTTAALAFNALNPMTTTGDMIYESATGVASRLAIGSTGNVLTVVGGIPAWAADADATFSGLNTDGVIYATSATAVAWTSVGTAGQVLTSNGSGVAPTFHAAAGGGATPTVQKFLTGSGTYT